MYVLLVIGASLERILGHVRYITLYLVSALGGSIASYLFSDLRTVSVGASGAIFGLMGALLVAGRLRYDIRQILILLVINIAIGFVFPGIDWRAHLGGLVTGAAVAAVFTFAPRRGRLWWQIGGIVALVAMLVAVTAWRTAALLDYIAPLGTTSV
jgi:membrane associated rhomboid family serine protease